MTQLLSIHPTHPQPRLIAQAAQAVRRGGVIVYPTDSCYALGCHIGDKDAAERLRRIREVDENHHFTLVCRDLSEIANFAKVDNAQYRLLKAATPGAYTFILEATREVPRRLAHPKRRTIGLRIPEHVIAQALLAELDEPILSTTLILPGVDDPLNDAEEIRAALAGRADLVIDGGACGLAPTTVVDMTGPVPRVLRAGAGPLAAIGLEETV
ncbi:MAG: threonylcarbamoyl-AMP synthase [Burkholderiales bacterium]|nr:threonylcarbamoyl-AMP synthase [Burkholderiales bacterium]